jgi:proteasome accessory factor A
MKKEQESRARSSQIHPGPKRLPKLVGADVELGNFILGLSRQNGTCDEASRALLREVEGYPNARHDDAVEGLPLSDSPPHHSFGRTSMYDPPEWPLNRGQDDHDYGSGYGSYYGGGMRYGGDSGDDADEGARAGGCYRYSSQDWGRKYLPANGGCCYIDLSHLELCQPESLSAYDHVALWHAMLRIARRALLAANERLASGQKIHVLVNSSDGQGNSYGSHQNFLITRRAWDNIFQRKIHFALYLAAFQASSIIYTGQGKVGGENGQPAVSYQISQRADFFKTLLGPQTTYHRPIINSRDETLCGRWHYYGPKDSETSQMARLHVIFFDSTLAHVACLLKVGVMQIILSMLEAEQVNPNLILDDPVEAVAAWSHDPTLHACARMAGGQKLTAVELQMLFLEEAEKFLDAGGCEGIVPRAGEILSLWKDTLLKLKAGEFAALTPRLDWLLKLSILQRAMSQRPALRWNSPQIKYLDHLYSSLDSAEGLYWASERAGRIQRVVTDEQIEHFVHEPPEDTRAYTRAMLLRAAGDRVDDCDWDYVRVKMRGQGGWPDYRTIRLGNPLAFTQSHTGHIFRDDAGLEEILDALEESAPGPERTGVAEYGLARPIAPVNKSE